MPPPPPSPSLAPWLALLPGPDELAALPLFWPEDAMEELDASSTKVFSHLREDVADDRA